MATVCFTPGILFAIASTRLITAWVFSTDVESGIWTLTRRYPLSWEGMKPVGVCSKAE